MLKVIYDLGAHNGADLPYYLHKADKVVAVEANPELAGQLSAKFQVAVQKGQLVVENVAVTEIEGEGLMTFFINNKADNLSTSVRPKIDSSHYSEVVVETASIGSLIRKHGLPYFVKVDLEGADMSILRAMAKENLFPPFISVEGHDPGVFGVLAAFGNYKSFKLQYGALVERQFKGFQFRDRFGAVQTYSFPAFAAGPFGDDLPSRWTTPQALNDAISLHGPGWYDIHASYGDPTADRPPGFRLNWVLRRVLLVYLRSSYPRLGVFFEAFFGIIRYVSLRIRAVFYRLAALRR